MGHEVGVLKKEISTFRKETSGNPFCPVKTQKKDGYLESEPLLEDKSVSAKISSLQN